MAIQGVPEKDTVSIYDPAARAYREMSIDDIERQMESLGLSKAEIAAKIKVLRGEK